MNKKKTEEFDLDVRHFIYQTFANTAKPPTRDEVAEHFQVVDRMARSRCVVARFSDELAGAEK